MEEVHHHEVLLEGDEDRLLGEVHQEVHHGVRRGDQESQALLEGHRREVHPLHHLDQVHPLARRLECHEALIQEGHQEEHLARQAGEHPLEGLLVVHPAVLLQGQFLQEVARLVLQHRLLELHLHLKAHPCKPLPLQGLQPHRNSAVYASSACEVLNSRLAKACLVRLTHTLD